jgi:cysteine desulfurase
MSSTYFNNAFSKQPSPEVLDAMKPFWRDEFEHPLTESEGAEKARGAIAKTRETVASLIHVTPDEIVFVSSGTEANNWALKGTAHQGKKNHLVISAIEHFSVYQTAQFLQRQSVDVTIVPVNDDGILDVEQIENAIRPNTFLVSIQSASDEIGVIQNLNPIAALKHKFSEVLFHTDAIQYVCYEDLDLKAMPFDLVSVSSNAIYGPAGIAALYVRNGTRIVPLLHGGMQEEGMRPGLQSIALVAGFGEAARLCHASKKDWRVHLSKLQDTIFKGMDDLGISVTGSRLCRTVDNVHMIVDVDGEAVLTLLADEGIRASSGSTCYQYAQKESHVLKALGIHADQARGALLFTLGVEQTSEDVDRFLHIFERTIGHLRNLKF